MYDKESDYTDLEFITESEFFKQFHIQYNEYKLQKCKRCNTDKKFTPLYCNDIYSKNGIVASPNYGKIYKQKIPMFYLNIEYQTFLLNMGISEKRSYDEIIIEYKEVFRSQYQYLIKNKPQYLE